MSLDSPVDIESPSLLNRSSLAHRKPFSHLVNKLDERINPFVKLIEPQILIRRMEILARAQAEFTHWRAKFHPNRPSHRNRATHACPADRLAAYRHKRPLQRFGDRP